MPGRTAGEWAAWTTSYAAGVLVRDSKDQAGPVLAFDPAAWTSFVRMARTTA